MSELTVGGLLLESLAAAGVRHVFGIPGDAVDPLMEALRRHPEIAYVQVRHEEAGALMASATAKLTGNLAVAFGTAGPGAVHLLNGVYDAALDRAPVLAVTGQVPTARLGSAYFQEVNLERLFDAVALYNRTVVSAEQAPTAIGRAVQTALRARGPCHLSFPGDVPTRRLVGPASPAPPASLPETLPVPEALDGAAALLARHRRVAILAGRGALEARHELEAFARALGAPVVHTLPAKGVLPDDHPLAMGGFGFLGVPSAHRAIATAELLLLLGTDYPYTQFLPQDAAVLQIDRDPLALGRRVPRAEGLLGSLRPTLAALREHPSLRRRTADTGWLEHLQEERRAFLARERAEAEREAPGEGPVAPQTVARRLSELLPEDAVVTADVGNCLVWLSRHFLARRQTFLFSSWLGTMGFGLPAALAAKLARPEATVVALVGDGGIAMLLAEFLTAVKYRLPVVVVVLRNDKLAMIKFEQELIGDPEWGVDLWNPDFAAFAEACGGFGLKAAHGPALLPALETALASGRPTIVDVATDPDVVPRPPVVTFQEARRYLEARVKETLGL